MTYGVLSSLAQIWLCVDKFVEGPEVVMIDWERVSDLESEIGVDGFAEVVDLFLEETDEVIGRLSTAPVARQIGKDMHFLKGSALNLGFTDLAVLCQDGERRAGLDHSVAVDLAAVISVYHESKAAFLMGMAQGADKRSSAA